MAYKQQPLNQDEFNMKIIKDLGITTASSTSIKKSRYAIFECTKCTNHFKARATGATARKQTTCRDCTLSKNQYYKHPLYAIWNGIVQRCYSTKRKDYHKYGGKGVTMCAEWRNDSTAFIDWCLGNGWNNTLVIDKDIKSRELEVHPIYSPDTLSFISTQQNAEEANAKIVEQYSTDGALLQEYPSASNAALHMDVVKSSIANCCRGILPTCKGYVWKYK